MDMWQRLAGEKETPDISREEWKNKYWARFQSDLAKDGLTPESVGISETQFKNSIVDTDMEGSYKQIYGNVVEKGKSDKGVADLEKTNASALEDLIAKSRAMQEGNLASFKEGRTKRLADLAALLGKSSEQAFNLNQPGILEDLSARNLLHTSGVGEALGREKARINDITTNTLQQQGLADLDAEQALASDIVNTELGLRKEGYADLKNLNVAGLERKFSLEDQLKSSLTALDLAKKQEAAANEAANKLTPRDLLNLAATGATTYAGMPRSPKASSEPSVVPANELYNPASKLNATGYLREAGK